MIVNTISTRLTVARGTVEQMDTLSERLILHPFTVAEAERVLAGNQGESDRWAGGYPFGGEVDLVQMFMRIVEESGDPAPFGPYIVIRRSDGANIGGVTFYGPPDDGGIVEFGFGLVPEARGQGLAREAISTALAIASENGAHTARADTTPDNVASQRVLAAAGFYEVSRTEETVVYQMELRP